MSERISFRRLYAGNLSRGVISYGIVDNLLKLTIPQIQQRFADTEEPIEAIVEAQWGGPQRPDRISFCGATYDFMPVSGLIVAQTTAVVECSTTKPGVIVHPNCTIRNSNIGSGTEISNTSTILDSRVGSNCIIESNTVVSGCVVYDTTHISQGEIFQSGIPDDSDRDRDFTELAYNGARW